MALRVEVIVKNSFIRYSFGQEKSVFDRKLSGKMSGNYENDLAWEP